METKNLGRLERITLRKAWENEASDFTPWLAEEKNLCLLAESIGIDLELDAQEKNVGPFRADILCKNTLDNTWVLIENQLERTDHTHLGQILTYGAGLEALTIVWIAAGFTEEHRATLDWLNEITDDRFNFFGIEIELWRIGDSPIAPKFNIVCKPNDWTRAVREMAGKKGELTKTRQAQLDFWTAFKKHMEENSFIKCQKPAPQHWMNHSAGRTGFTFASVAATWNADDKSWTPNIGMELVLNDEYSKIYFAILEINREDIENELGFTLKWHNPENKKLCRIYLRKDDNFLNSELWPKQHEWLRKKLEKFHSVFGPYIKVLDVSEYDPEDTVVKSVEDK